MTYTEKDLKKFNRLKSKYFSKLVSLNYPKEILDKEYLQCDITEGNLHRLKDFIWSSFNTAIYLNRKRFQFQSFTYLNMAEFNMNEEDGKMVEELKKLSADSLVNDFLSKDNSIIPYEGSISVREDACSVCKVDKNKKFDVQELIKRHPLPHKNCTCSGMGCNCRLVFSAKRDEDGKLILNLGEKKSKETLKEFNAERKGASMILKFFDWFKK